MKKKFTVGCSLLLGIAAADGQGTVNFNNNGIIPGNPPSMLVFYGAPAWGHPLTLGDGHYVAQLYYGAPGTAEGSLTPVDTPPASFRSATTGFPGTWAGGIRTLVGFFNNGGPNDPKDVVLQVRVWDIGRFPDYGSAYAAEGNLSTGKSFVFSYVVPEPTAPSSAFLMQNFQGFIVGIPEPPEFLLLPLGLLTGILFKQCSKRK